MPRYESLRDRLPSLYRPDADETAAPLLRLGRDDLADIRGESGPIRFTTDRRDGSLVVRLLEPGPARALQLLPGRAPGAGFALDLRALEAGGAVAHKPFAVLPIVDSVAPVGRTALPETFVLRLKQRGLLDLQLLAVAGVLERMNREASDVMQSHWFRYADRAVNNPFFLRGRALQGLGMPNPNDPAVVHFPYITDLGRLASLLSLAPWQEPIVQNGDNAATPEAVETYRKRIYRIVKLYENGLGTVEALRRMTEAQLPVDVDAPAERRDRPFTVEELAPLATVKVPVHAPGQPTDRVGPLMHWPLVNDGVAPVAPTVFVQAPTTAELEEVAPDGELSYRPADAPLVELYRGGPLRVGLAFRDTVPDGKTLRLRPSFSSWLGLGSGVGVAVSVPGEDEPDPTAPGPWAPSEGGPGGAISALLRTAENALWAAVETGELWRRDGAGWAQLLVGLPPVHCLAEDGLDLLLGTDGGLLRLPRFPEGAFAATAEPDPDGRVVHALLHAADGTWWAGTSKGLGRIEPGDHFAPTPFVAEVRALAADTTGAVYAGGAAGLAAHGRDADQWWWYSGEAASDEVSEWRELDPADAAAFPTDPQIFLPPVTAVLRARDGTLWIGSEHGLARYVARGDGGPVAFRTMLEAFPDVAPTRVNVLVEDERCVLWVGTSRGLLRYDGRDWHEFRAEDGWTQLGRAESLYPPGADPVPRGAWRFRRAGATWERFDTTLAAPVWVPFAGEPRTTAQPEVRSVAFTDGVIADVVDTWEPDGFAVAGSAAVDPTRLVVRVKLDSDRRVVDGGMPALPRLPAGSSEWRYLSLEPTAITEPSTKPAWTVEGRLLPAESDAPDPEPGRYDQGLPDPFDEPSEFDEAVYAFPPAARVGFAWEPAHALSTLVRLGSRGTGDSIDPATLDRVFDGMQQVRPAGTRATLAFGARTVRKET